MASVYGMLRGRAAYFFIAVGVVWAVVGLLSDLALVAWPAVACIAGGALLLLVPSHRLTWPWLVATAAMGFLVSVYQVYAWSPLVGGAFSTLADEATAGFAVFALVHVLLFFTGAWSQRSVRPGTS
ncbi:MAG: hypothetical protein JRN57_02235 [Nitrososphaerota archaeon]|nr:hypothetical protein [Nitrososphaerota archaeon]